MATTYTRFLILVISTSCGQVSLPAQPDAGAVPADATLDDARASDARPADAGPPPIDATLLDAAGCERFDMLDLFGYGRIAPSVVVQGLGQLTASRCLAESCSPRDLFVGSYGLGVLGSVFGGDNVSGYDRVVLELERPARVTYRMHNGLDNGGVFGSVHHAFTASLDDVEVLDLIVDAREYESSPTPLSNEIVWSAILVEDESGFADGFTVEWVELCPAPAPSSRSASRL